MFGSADYADDGIIICPDCGFREYPEVGMGRSHNCPKGDARRKAELERWAANNPPGSSMYDDPRSVTFDTEKAFFLLRDLGRLDECC